MSPSEFLPSMNSIIMRKLLCLFVTLACGDALAVVLADDAYVCRDQPTAARIQRDPELKALDGRELLRHAAERNQKAADRLQQLDKESAALQERVNADRDAVKSAKALDFQAGVKQSWRPAEQSAKEGEQRLGALRAEHQQLIEEQKWWTSIGTSCAALSGGRATVVRRSGNSGLAEIRRGAHADRVHGWVPERFLVRPQPHAD